MTRILCSDLTLEEIDAITTYAAEHGRTWKRQLLDDWMHCRLWGPIHHLRNTRGPSWLARFRFPASRIPA